MFTLIFVSLFVAGWLCAALLPWLAVSVATKGEAGLGMLALCLLAGVACGLAVPLLGADGGGGLGLSFLVSALASALLLAARRFAAPAREARRYNRSP